MRTKDTSYGKFSRMLVDRRQRKYFGKNKERTKKINAKYNGLTFTIKLDQTVIRNKNTAKYMLTRGQFKFWVPMV